MFFIARSSKLLYLLSFLLLFVFFSPVTGESAPGARIRVNEFRVTGNEAIDTGDILKAVDPHRFQDYTFGELKAIAEIVTSLYHENGYMLARAYLPNQKIDKGIVTISVVEGKLGRVEVNAGKYYSKALIRSKFKALAGHTVNENSIERSILLTRDVPSLDISTTLVKGAIPGTADLVVTAEDKLPIALDFEYNNYGNKMISSDRFMSRLSLADPYMGSTLTLTGLVGDTWDDWNNTYYAGIDWSVPITSFGTKAGFNYMKAAYVVGGDYEVLDIEGESEIIGVTVMQPLKRSRNWNLTTTAGIQLKRYKESVLGMNKSNDDLTVGYIAVDYDSVDDWNGRNYFSTKYSHGFENTFGSLGKDDPVASRYGASGRFDKVNANYVRIQKVYGDLLLLSKFSGQYSFQQLVSPEQFAIGGPSTIRGHKNSKYMGDHGYVASFELSSPLPVVGDKQIMGRKVSDLFRAVVFVDHGGVYKRSPILFGEGNNNYLTSVGVGARLYLYDWVNVKFDVGVPYKDSTLEWDQEIFYLQVNAKLLNF